MTVRSHELFWKHYLKITGTCLRLFSIEKKPQKLFPSHYSIPLILWKCSFYTYFKTDMFTFWDLELQRKMRKIKLRMDCCESGREAGEGAEDDPWGICVNLSHKFSRKIRKGRRKCRTYFMKCCIEEAERLGLSRYLFLSIPIECKIIMEWYKFILLIVSLCTVVFPLLILQSVMQIRAKVALVQN